MSHEPPVKKRQRIDASNSSSPTSSSSSSTNSIDNLVDVESDWLEALQVRQCLCGVPDPWRPFQRYIGAHDADTDKLEDWPIESLLKSLSNIALFFDVYLKQNRHGNICGKLAGLVKSLVDNHSKLNIIDDLLGLCERRLQCKGAEDTKFCTFLACKVISYYLIVVKDHLKQEWLDKIVDNLFNFECLNDLAIRKINFSLDVIRNIIEFKDTELHPLDEVVYFDAPPLPPIENNYFAQQWNGASNRNLFGENSSSSSSSSNSSSSCNSSNSNPNPSCRMPSNCQFVTLTDSESFDTTNIKIVTVQSLENTWPALVTTMTTLITLHQANPFTESCTIAFLELWENIISVKSNLSVIDTLPFQAKLDRFCSDLFRSHSASLNATLYKQMLALFNEALCYGSTLALQDLLPQETTNLAHQIVRQVKDFRVLDTLPRQSSVTEFGGKSAQIEYEPNSFTPIPRRNNPDKLNCTYDRTLMQKMTLLVLKSVAVTVKEIRSDSSSDSSFNSQDDEAIEDMRSIEASIRAVITKLEHFIKAKMEFHPESHFSKILIHLFSDQDDYLIEAMVCTLDVTTGINFRPDAFPQLVATLNPVFTFLEFLKMISNSHELLIDLLVSNETCFLLYLLRFLKYVRVNWNFFVQSCQDLTVGGANCLDDTMTVLIRLRQQVSKLVARNLFPYEIGPILRLIENCESLYEGQMT